MLRHLEDVLKTCLEEVFNPSTKESKSVSNKSIFHESKANLKYIN